MRIVQVMGGAETGGLETHFTDLCNTLGRQYPLLAIAHPRYGNAFEPGHAFYPLDLARSRYDPRSLTALARTIRAWQPDIIHAHGGKAAAMVSLLRHALPGHRVVTVHNNRRRPLRHLRHFQGVIAVSREEYERLEGLRRAHIPNGISPGRLENSAPADLHHLFNLPADKPVWLAAGRLVPVKGFDWLLDAWEHLDASLIIAGEGPQRRLLEHRCKALGLDNRVRLPGQRDDLPALLRAADAAVIPSRSEGFPYFLVEALMLERPVIASQVSGCRELLPAEVLVPPQQSATLRERIQQALDDPDWLRDQCTPAFRQAREELTVEAMAARTLAFYQQVLNP